jgi:hypothetical protein
MAEQNRRAAWAPIVVAFAACGQSEWRHAAFDMDSAPDLGGNAVVDLGGASGSDLAGDAGDTPLGDGLLLADSGAGLVFLLSLDGATVRTYHSPVPNVTGVAHDRRAGDGFWVVGPGAPYTFYKLDWQGNTVRQIQNTGGATGAQTEWEVVDNDIRGLDYYADPNPAEDVLEFVKLNVARIDTATTIFAASGEPVESAGFFMGSTAQSGYWGCHVLDDLMHEQRRWCTRRGGTLERFSTATPETSLSIPATDPRGVALDEQGQFYVVDRANTRILVLDANGGLLRSFPTPGAAPEGLSYGQGPTENPIP